MNQVQIAPRQWLLWIEAIFREENLVVGRAVRGCGVPRHAVSAVIIWHQRCRRPVGTRFIECRVLLSVGAAPFAIRDQLSMAAIGGAYIDLHPVVKRLWISFFDVDAFRIIGCHELARVDP